MVVPDVVPELVPGLVPVEVGGEGDCQFLSILHQLQLAAGRGALSQADLQRLVSPLTALEVRRIAVAGLGRLAALRRFTPDLMGSMVNGTGHTVQEHITQLSRRGGWAAEETLWGASFELTARLGRPVHINMYRLSDGWGRRYTPEGDVNVEEPQDDDNVITLNLAFVNEGHYQSLVPRGEVAGAVASAVPRGEVAGAVAPAVPRGEVAAAVAPAAAPPRRAVPTVGQNSARRGVAFPEAMCNAFHGGSKAVVKARGTTCHG